jgi:hypothetical protein
MGEIRKTFKILIGKPEVKGPLGRSRRKIIGYYKNGS